MRLAILPALLALGPAIRPQDVAVEPAILVRSPGEYQVFQRWCERSGTIVISGRVRVGADRIEIRVTGDGSGRTGEAWRALPLVRATGAFSSTLEVPAGGWYGLRLRAGKDGETVAEANVERFGVGEVFVGAGQSNSTNAGEHRTRQHSGMVSTFDGTSWRLADDPQPGVHDRSTGGSFWPAFGDALHGRLGVPIGVAVTGHGGTSVGRWRPDGELYGWMLRRIHRLGPLGFRAVLWHQGESDSLGTPGDEYYAALRRIILQSREDAGWELPWFVAQATYLDPQRPSFPGIRSAQARLWEDGIALRGPDTDELRGDHRDHDGQGIHFSPEGLKAHGELWAGILGDYVEACHGR